MGRKIKGKNNPKTFSFSTLTFPNSKENSEKIKKQIDNVEVSNGFENLRAITNHLNSEPFVFTINSKDKEDLEKLIELKRVELESPKNIQKRASFISKTLSESAERRKREKEAIDERTNEFNVAIIKANTKNKLTRLSNKIEKDLIIKNKFELLDKIRKKKRSI